MTWDDALSKTILYLHNLNRYQNPPTTSCLLSFIKRSHIFVGPQPNQTGPLNIAGGLEGEGNDLGSHHTSLETEIHHRQTDRRTDKSWGGEPTSLSVLSPLHPLKKKVKHWLCRPQSEAAREPEGQEPRLFVLQVDLRGLPVLRGFLQACLKPDALQVFLKFDLLLLQTSFPDLAT